MSSRTARWPLQLQIFVITVVAFIPGMLHALSHMQRNSSIARPAHMNLMVSTFSCVSSVQFFTVPSHAERMVVTLVGASGGSFVGITNKPGGNGASITSTVPVTPGQIYQLFVGCSTNGPTGGYNGGGTSPSPTAAYGFGGGGATDLRKSPFDLASRIMVAGGGGGASGECDTSAAGGNAGYPDGSSGPQCLVATVTPKYGGGGATGTTAPGAPGEGCTNPGTLGIGGDGCGNGGGGGGGYYGGGGSLGSGGGGGSSYSSYAVTASSSTNVGNGFATIEYVYAPTITPTQAPTPSPTKNPTATPTALPTSQPSSLPTGQPSSHPSQQPSTRPTRQPTTRPTRQPTSRPSRQPTSLPSSQPSGAPSGQPSICPTAQPTARPSQQPSSLPSCQPSQRPTAQPSGQPSSDPTQQPTSQPTGEPTMQPSIQPSSEPSAQPSVRPSTQPTRHPSAQPTSQPAIHPSRCPSVQPSVQPSTQPSRRPSAQPSVKPSMQPSRQPSRQPSSQPSGMPSAQPSTSPTSQPSRQPSAQPTAQPSLRPSCQPSAEPTIRTSGIASRVVTPAPNITELDIAASRSSITVRVHIASTAGAFVHCGAFATPRNATYYALRTVNELELGGSSALYLGSVVTVTLEDLVPSTNYTVFCATQSLSGALLSLPAVVQTAYRIETLCCREVAIKLELSSIVEGTALPSAGSVSIIPAPEEPVKVDLYFVDAAGSPVNASTVYPSTIVISNASAAPQSIPFAVLAGKVGKQRLVAVLSGLHAGHYQPSYEGFNACVVISRSQPPPAPRLLSGQFTDDGTSVVLRFDSTTDRAGYNAVFPCAALLLLQGSADALCVWKDSSTVTVYPRCTGVCATDTLVAGSSIVLIANKIRAACNSKNSTWCGTWPTTPEREVFVAVATNPTAPVLSMTVPVSISACSSLTVDLTTSTGGGGRPWRNVSFAVVTSPPSSKAARMLESFLQTNYSLSPPTSIPSSVLRAGYSYTIQARLCNYLGACGTAARTVFVSQSQSAALLATILGAADRTIRRNEELVLSGNCYTTSCAGVRSFDNIVRTWTFEEITPGEAVKMVTGVRSQSQNPAIFKLAALTLRAQAIYRVTINATAIGSIASATASAVVRVLPGIIMARISGNSERWQVSNVPFVVDASSSYDEDYPGLDLASAGMSFAWSCFQIAPAFSGQCVIQYDAPTETSSRLSALAGDAAVGTVSRIIVTVSDATRSSSAFVDTTITSAPTSYVSVRTALTSLSNVNTNGNLALIGFLNPASPCRAEWSINDPAVALSTAALTPIAVSLQAQSKEVPFNLVVAGGKLPQRSKLVFTLTCGDVWASVTLTTNGPPLPGLFAVDPAEGNELATMFLFSAVQWTDPDLPLTYLFGFESETSNSTLVIVSRSEFSYTSTNLPAGLAGSQYRLNCSLEVFDSAGARSSAVFPVTVKRATEVTVNLMAVLQLLNASAGSVDDTKRVLSVSTAVINTVNCSSAPNCTALHRDRCAATSHSCGQCIEGYLGDAGDQNTPCFPSSLAVSSAPAENCTNDSECRSWEYCAAGIDPGKRVCSIRTKACLGNCSDHGECVYTTTSTEARLTASQCTIDDPYCKASCACDDQYSGRLCEISNADLRGRRAVRSLLIGSLLNLTAVEDINQQSAKSWAASLYFLALRPFELSGDDASVIMEIANSTISRARSMQMPSDQLTGILQAVDAVMAVRRYNYNPNDYEVTDFGEYYHFVNNTAAVSIPVVDAFVQLSGRSIVLGEGPSTFVYENFRVSSSLHGLPPAGRNISLQTPQTVYERAADAPPSSLVLIPATGASSNTSTVAVDLITVFPRAYTADTSMYDADPIYLRVHSDAGDEVVEYLAGVEFTFTPYKSNSRTYGATANVTSICAGNSTTTLVTEVCPGSGRVIVHNCTGVTGKMESTCPQLMPSCARLSVVDATLTPMSQCELHSYNMTATVCMCRLDTKSNPGARRLDVDGVGAVVIDSTGVTNVATISVYVGESFTSTFSAAPEFTTAEALAQVVIVLYLFGTLWGAGLVLAAATAVQSDPRLYSVLTRKLSTDVAKVKPAAAEAGPKERFLSYIAEVVPQVYADGKRGIDRLLAEVCTHHRYMTLFTLGDGKITYYHKMIILLKVLTVDTMQMFLLAALYDLQCPDDDGSCTDLSSEDTCLARTSVLDSTHSFCRWQYDSARSAYTCSYRPPTIAVWTFIYIFVMASMATSLFNMPTDYLFAVCAAPVGASAIGDETDRSILGRVSFTTGEIVRRVSKTAAATVQPVTRRLSNIVHKARASILGANAVIDTDGSEDLRQRHASVVQVLPGILHRAKFREENRAESASLIRAMAIRKYSSIKGASSGRFVPGEEEVRKGELADSAYDLESAQPSASIHTLFNDIITQRLLLSDSERTRVFDAQWGVTRPDVRLAEFELTASAHRSIQASVEEANKIAEAVNAQMPKYTAQQAGLVILHLFIQDLLGRNTPAAKIFNSKFEENHTEAKTVSAWSRGIALGSIVLCNAFFVYYALLKAYVKGQTWQKQYAVACVVQMVVEVLLNETLECLWLNYWVPSLVRKDVCSAVHVLHNVAEDITITDTTTNSTIRVFLDAPPHLFASSKVAAKHGRLLESVLVLSYHSHLPGELCKTWPHYAEVLSRTDDRSRAEETPSMLMKVQRFGLRSMVTAVATVVAMIQWSGTLSFDYQRIIIRIIQPLLFTGLTMLGYYCTSSAGGFALFAVGVLSVIATVAWMRYNGNKQAAMQLLQVAPAVELDPDVEEELEHELALHRASSVNKRGDDSSSSSSEARYEHSDHDEVEQQHANASTHVSGTRSHEVRPAQSENADGIPNAAIDEGQACPIEATSLHENEPDPGELRAVETEKSDAAHIQAEFSCIGVATEAGHQSGTLMQGSLSRAAQATPAEEHSVQAVQMRVDPPTARIARSEDTDSAVQMTLPAQLSCLTQSAADACPSEGSGLELRTEPSAAVDGEYRVVEESLQDGLAPGKLSADSAERIGIERLQDTVAKSKDDLARQVGGNALEGEPAPKQAVAPPAVTTVRAQAGRSGNRIPAVKASQPQRKQPQTQQRRR